MIRSACLLPVLVIGLAPAFASVGCSDETGSPLGVASAAARSDSAIACCNLGDAKKMKRA